MAGTFPNTRASKIRRFGPLASAANRNLQRDNLKGFPDTSNSQGERYPALTTEVQRSLLHVGMKVRKSVLNGYKTGLEALEQALDAASTHGAETKPSRAAITVNSFRPIANLAASGSDVDSSGATGFSFQVHNACPGTRRKRSLEIEAEQPTSPLDTDMSIDAGTSQAPDQYDRKIRRFAIPRSRRNYSMAAQPMDLDPFIYTDETGDFADADFLVPE